MKCSEVQEIFCLYWDLPKDDLRRIRVDEHTKRCASCAEEFDIWKESTHLIQAAALSSIERTAPAQISSGVMERIYSSESWRIPVPDRTYNISYRLRRQLTVIIAFCLALFMFSALSSIFLINGLNEPKSKVELGGLLPVANALGEEELGSSDFTSIEGVAVASLSDPLVLKVGVIQTTPDYLFALSFLGLIGALLIMNWLSRIKA
jgi:predicted anti-sigma-YlaC factor YlaD